MNKAWVVELDEALALRFGAEIEAKTRWEKTAGSESTGAFVTTYKPHVADRNEIQAFIKAWTRQYGHDYM